MSTPPMMRRRPGTSSYRGRTPGNAPSVEVTLRICRGRPAAKAWLHSVCHCQVRNTVGSREPPTRSFHPASSSEARPDSTSTFIGAAMGSEVSGIARAARIHQAALVATSVALAHGLVHRGIEVFAQILPHLVAPLPDDLGHAAGIVLVEIAIAGWIGDGIEAGVFGLHGGETGHQAGQLGAAAPRTSRAFGRGEGADEQAEAPLTALALVLVDRHPALPRPVWMRHSITQIPGLQDRRRTLRRRARHSCSTAARSAVSSPSSSLISSPLMAGASPTLLLSLKYTLRG